MKDIRAVLLSMFVLCLQLLSNAHSVSAGPLDTWHVRNSVPGGYTLNAVTYGNGIFVAVGSGGTILSSPDGANWTARTSGTTHDLHAVTFGNGLFVAVGSTRDVFGYPRGNAILTSPDGITWTTRISNAEGTGPFPVTDLNSVAFGDGSFVAAGALGYVLVSTDGIVWSHSNSVPICGWNGITWGNGIFVAGGCLDGRVVTSPDGLNWTERPTNFSTFYLFGLAYGTGLFVAVGRDGSTNRSMILTSPDGISWTQSLTDSPYLLGVTFGNNIFVAVGVDGSMATSFNGVDWINVQSGRTESLYGVVYGKNTFVAVGSDGLIVQSAPFMNAVGIPTLSEWGMILLAIACGFAAIRTIQRSMFLKPC